MSTLETIVGECRTYSDRIDTHDHDYAQLLLPLDGNLFIQTVSQSVQLQRSHLFFLPPHCQHRFHANDRNQCLVLDIPQFAQFSPPDQAREGGIKLEIDDRWQALRQLLLTEISRTDYSLTELVQYAYRLLHSEPHYPSIQYIQDNYMRSISLRELANIEGYNLTYYCEWFKSITGTTPKHHIQTLRLNQAKQLLSETDWPILHIAQQVGYEHQASLTRLFKQFGQPTPQAYRRQTRKSAKTI
jgi:AraC-like DNA-binding protein